MASWVAAAMHLLLLCNAAAAARAAVALFAAAVDGTATPLPPRLSLAEAAAAAVTGDYDDGTGTGTREKGSQAIVGSPIVAGAMNDRLRALTSSFAAAIGKKLDYCIKDTETEWNQAFDFSKDTSFLTNCMKETKGTYPSYRTNCRNAWTHGRQPIDLQGTSSSGSARPPR